MEQEVKENPQLAKPLEERIQDLENYTQARIEHAKQIWETEKPYIEVKEEEGIQPLFDFQSDIMQSINSIYEELQQPHADQTLIERMNKLEPEVQRWNRLYTSFQRATMQDKMLRSQHVTSTLIQSIGHWFALQCENTLETINDLFLSEKLDQQALDEIKAIFKDCYERQLNYLEWSEVPTQLFDTFYNNTLEAIALYEARIAA